MREILFRGQTRRKGEKVRMDGSPVESNWVYGGVLCGSGDHSIIYQTEPDIAKKVVYTDTLGQYTGLTDKNGTKIFEGDVVRISEDYYDGLHYSGNEVYYSDGAFCVEYETPEYDVTSIGFLVREGVEVEVIGNIYDNPELIGGADNENS